jgi:hypothetical protein
MHSNTKLYEQTKKTMNDHVKETKSFQVVITLFYGQFISSAIFENLIRTIPDMTEEKSIQPNYGQIIKVIMGCVFIILSVVSLIAVWKKKFNIILLSGIFLCAILTANILMATVNLTLTFETMDINNRFKTLAKLIVESVFQLIGIAATFHIHLLSQLEKQNLIINELINQVDLLQSNFDNILPVLTKNIDFDINVLTELESNIKKAKEGRRNLLGGSGISTGGGGSIKFIRSKNSSRTSSVLSLREDYSRNEKNFKNFK